MSLSIISCPSCTTLLLSDTVQCPTCLHVLDQKRAAHFPLERKEDRERRSRHEDPCPVCGEMVRHGLVRCWSCGSFMKDEIADTYQQMQEAPQEIIYSYEPAPEDAPSASPTPSADSPPAAEDPLPIDDDDFQLAPEFRILKPMEVDTPEEEGSGADTYHMLDVEEKPERPAGRVEGQESRVEGQRAEGDAAEIKSQKSELSAAADAGSGPSTLDPRPGAAADAGPQPSTLNPQPSTPPEPAVDHSVATAGDALLQVALAEEAEETRRRAGGGKRKRSDARQGFLIYCPNGHRIEVQEKHRGMRGRCPKCKTAFLVPSEQLGPPVDEQTPPAEQTGEAAEAAPAAAPGRFVHWMNDVHFHAVNPTKLRLRPGSLKSAYEEVDLGFGAEELLVVVLAKKNPLFGSPDKKKREAVRQAVRAHLAEDKPLEELPGADRRVFNPTAARGIGVVQPVIYAHESMFGGVPVFGEGRIAVRLPSAEGAAELMFLSFVLSGFREFAGRLRELYGIEGLGEDVGVPLEDEWLQMKCHFSDEPVRFLDRIDFYKSDPAIELKLVGRRCKECGLVVSEESRRKEKIGGLNGRGIAKAKCPKCGKKFGDVSLYALDEPEAPAAAEPEADATADENVASGNGAPAERQPEPQDAATS
ncbi:MAG: hypothetical protein KY476_13210 [Planctomycetes bacterium]|nr:hypothetical protein [Planctomycetota bacterium]